MNDTSAKSTTLRTATARTSVRTTREALEKIREKDLPQGDPFIVARIAAIQAAKNTGHLLPDCHVQPIDAVEVHFEITDDSVEISTAVRAIARTGVGMEALTAASVAALAIIDSVKSLDRKAVIAETRLLKSSGGKASYREVFPRVLRAGVLVMSDSISSGKKKDESGRIIVERLKAEKLTVEEYLVIPDEPAEIARVVTRWCDELKLDVVVTTGGTGITPRDRTPESIRHLLDRELPGVAEAMRSFGQDRTPYSMLSRSFAGIRGDTIVVCMPGSRKGVRDSLNALFPALLHAFKMVWGGSYARHKHTEESES